MTGIYMIRNKVNGKVYIGQSLNVEKRWKDHKRDLKYRRHNNPYLQRAYDKKPDAFEYILLEECPEAFLDLKEEQYISSYDAANSAHGYNIYSSAIGSGRTPESTKAKMSEASPIKRSVICIETGTIYTSIKKAYRETGISDENIRRNCTGDRSCANGLHWAYLEDYEKNPDYYHDLIKDFVPKNRDGVICLETGKYYNTAMEAERLTGAPNTSIGFCCRGRYHTAGGYHWAYYQDYMEKPEYYADILRKFSLYGNKGCKPVVCVETGTLFSSVGAAAAWAGIARNNLSTCLSGKSKTAGGYHWRFCNEDDAERAYPMAV